MTKRWLLSTTVGAIAGICMTGAANATLIDLGSCNGANDCIITGSPPNPVEPDPNDGILLAWDEVQNHTLADPLRVDRVFDSSASFITDVGGGDFEIDAGTIVSSHYIQWDPGVDEDDNVSSSSVQTTISLDSQIFAFMTEDVHLEDSDSILGLSGLDYNDFNNRGLEGSDITNFNGEDVDIDWTASSPGDWTRLITARSPAAADVPEPGVLAMFGVGLAGIGFAARRRRRV